MSNIYLIEHTGSPLVEFGVAELRRALLGAGYVPIGPHPELRGESGETPAIRIRHVRTASLESSFVAGADGKDGPQYPDESFSIQRSGRDVIIEASDPRGLIYGCLELVDLIATREWERADLRLQKTPTLPVRGVKFNLPFEPYAAGDPFRENEATCLDSRFWIDFIDELARGRYNCLSLWSLHPFHLLVSSPRFRNANPYSDAEIAEHEALFHTIFGHALSRGVDIYLFTWNIYLPTPVAKGLGLPAALSNTSEGTSEVNRWDAARARQRSPIVAEYYEEMVYRVLTTYTEVSGIGTSGSEAMSGTGEEKEQWVVDTYLKAIRRSGRRVKFIHRTNMQVGKDIETLARPEIDPSRFYLSWKYSNAHCYSHPRPAFEALWKAWDGIDLDDTQVLYTIRNDDVHTHRWADAEYVREYLCGVKDKGYVHGFYWGADGYTWGRDFQHVDHGHKSWRWDFERHRQQFQLWGRLGYDVEMPEQYLERSYLEDYGDDAADMRDGLAHASRIIPAVNRLVWLNYDFEWHPEGCLTRDAGFRTVLDFLDSTPMPGAEVIGIQDYARSERDSGLSSDTETPESIIALLRDAADSAVAAAERIDGREAGWRASLARCAALDLRSMAALGRYYAGKIEGSLELARFAITGDAAAKDRSVKALQDAITHWENVGYYWSQHYKPYQMARVARTFGYPFYLDDVRRDVQLARNYKALI